MNSQIHRLRNSQIICYGSLNIDYVYQVEEIASPGETINSKSLEIFPGGKGANQALAAARRGCGERDGGADRRRDVPGNLCGALPWDGPRRLAAARRAAHEGAQQPQGQQQQQQQRCG